MKRLLKSLVVLCMVATANAAVTTHLKLDCRTGARACSAEGETLLFDASWYENGEEVRITDNGAVLTNGMAGVYTWLPESCSSTQHVFRLEVLAAGQVVGAETADFSCAEPMLEHTTVITQPAVAPTSSKPGMTAEIRCSRCGEIVQAATEIPALGYIRNVTARQLWPHKKVEVCYTLADDIGEVVEDGAELALRCSSVTPGPMTPSVENASSYLWTQSGTIWQSGGKGVANLNTSYITCSATGPATVSFKWKVSSESNYDKLHFYVDGNEVLDAISGEVDWQEKAYSLDSGAHTLKWSYTKDGSADNGSDCGWVDAITVTADGSLSVEAKNVIGDASCAPGLHRVVWDMEADGISAVNPNVRFSVQYVSFGGQKGAIDVASAVWSGRSYDPASWQSSEGNVLRGLTGLFSGTRHDEPTRISLLDPISWLTDSIVNPVGDTYSNTWGIKNGTLTWEWVAPISLSMLRINTHWGDGGRDGVCLNGVKVLTIQSPTWQDLPNSSVTYGWGSGTSGDLEITYKTDGKGSFASGVVGICFDFGNQENNGSGFTEIEVVTSAHVCAEGISEAVAIDMSEHLCDGMTVGFSSKLPYSSIDAGNVALEINGREAVSATESGMYMWTPERPGTYVHTHLAGTNVFTRKVVCPAADDAKELEIGWLDGPISNLFPNIYASVTNVVIGPTLMHIPADAFAGCDGLGLEEQEGVVIYHGCVLGVKGECPAQVELPEGIRLIADGAFRNCSTLASISIPSSVKSIGARAFANCTELEEIVIPEGVETIGDGAFENCTWAQAVELPTTLKRLGKFAFANCSNLDGVECFDGLESVGECAFSNCWRMLSVALPASVDEIGAHAFYNCKNLLGVTIPAHVDTMAHLFPDVYQTIPSVVIAEGETELTAGVFGGCALLEEVELPDEIAEIPASTFEGCSEFRRIRFPSGLVRIGNRAFYGCGQIWELELPDGLLEIGDDAFNGLQQVRDLVCPSSVRTIGARAFKGVWNDVEVKLPAGLESLGADAFADCSSIRKISLPAVATPIKTAFPAAYAQIESVKILGAPETIPPEFCRDVAQLADVKIPNTVTNIGDYAFAGLSNLAAISLPPNLETIGQYAFQNDSRLVTVQIPQSVVSVGYRAFYGCANVRIVGCPGGLGTLSTLFPSAYSQITTVSINAGTTDLMDDLMSGCSKLSEIDVPVGVTNIGARVFKNCSALAAFGVPNGVDMLGSDVFNGCTGLTSLSLPEGLGRIPSCAFYNCSALSSLVIPASVAYIGPNAFYGCSALKSISYLGSCPGFDSACYNGTASDLVSYVVNGSRGWDGVPTSKSLPEYWPTANARSITTWEPNTFEATFSGNGGAPASSVVVQTTGMTYVLPENEPTLNGARFNGWWTQPVNGGQIKATTKVEVMRAQTFYAHWKYNGYAVRFDANGGLGEMEDQVMTVNTATELAANRFVRKDRRFAGWSLTPDGEIAFEDGAAVENLSFEQDAVVTLYAVWAEQAWDAADYLNVSGRSFVFAGDADWIADDEVSHDGIGSMRSGAIVAADEGLRTRSVLRTTVNGTGAGSFWWKVDCEPNEDEDYYDYCVFRIDGVVVAQIAGKVDWEIVDYEITRAGEHVLEWEFTRDDWDEDESLYENATWVDEFAWTPTPVSLTFDANGAEGEVPAAITKSAGCEVTLPQASSLTKAGMTFCGWTDGENVWQAGDTYTLGSSDIVLRAVWEAKVWTLEEAAGLVGMSLTTGGNAVWTVDLTTNYDGTAAIRSGVIGDSQSTWVALGVSGAGTVGFRVLVSGEYSRGKMCDYLKLEVDGVEAFSSYNANWSNVVVDMSGAGAHTLKWTYLKNASKSAGDDCAWLDNLVWTPSAAPVDPIPDIGETPTAAEVAAAVADAADPKVSANIDETNYNDFRDWAGKVKMTDGADAGALGVMGAENAWLSYALGQGTLLEAAPTDEDLTVEAFVPAAEAGKFDFTVSVKDVEVGSDAAKENLKKVFGLEGAESLDSSTFSRENVEIEFDMPVDGKVKFTAGPKEKGAETFFMKVKMAE